MSEAGDEHRTASEPSDCAVCGTQLDRRCFQHGKDEDTGEHLYRMVCLDGCGHEGPIEKDVPSAIRAWNIEAQEIEADRENLD